MKSLKKNIKFSVGDSPVNPGFKSNYVDQTKYSLFTFVPKSLIIQFMRLSNVYFLIAAIIQSIPQISPFNPGTAVAPLAFILIVSMVREAFEDYARYKHDVKLNNEPTFVLRKGAWVKCRSKNILTGDTVLVHKDEAFPADLVLVGSRLENNICYVETASLDGEKYLKQRSVVSELNGAFGYSDNPLSKVNINGTLTCDSPNSNLYSFTGILTRGINKIYLNESHLLLKGTMLRNTPWVVGIAVYVGHSTKLIQNSKKPRTKTSQLENLLGKVIFFIFAILIGITALCAMNFSVYHNAIANHFYIFEFDPVQPSDRVLIFFTYLILLNTFIPISLQVTLEVIKLGQGMFLSWDFLMFNKEKKKKMKASATNLNEECGKINYIFSDKTGTITANKMNFCYYGIGKKVYFIKKEDKIVEFSEQDQMKFIRHGLDPEIVDEEGNGKLHGQDGRADSAMIEGKEINYHHEYWKCIGLANDCFLWTEGNNSEIIGVSPDDIEILQTAKVLGISLSGRSSAENKELEILKETKRFKVIEKLEFTSDRKRMSVVVQEGDTLKLYIKGADSEIYSRLAEKGETEKQTLKNLEFFSEEGYRTLMVGMKLVKQEDLTGWKAKYTIAKQEKDLKRMEELENELESGLFLLGITVIEDKLQENVPETIKDLRLAGMKIWMLTGDKLSTALNISVSCNLFDNKSIVLTLRGEDENVLESFENEFQQKMLTTTARSFSVILDNLALKEIMKSSKNMERFLEIAMKAEAVVFSRVSPLQKSLVLKAVKAYDSSAVTLAIGDGGNDISMIMEANVGVGIYGQEGIRAAQAGDFAVGEFQHLRRLLIHHGRNNLARISEMVLYFFYKNFFFTLTHVLFGFYSNFSGQTIIDDWNIVTFNMFFSSLPLMMKALFEYDADEEDSDIVFKLIPFLYEETNHCPTFSTFRLIGVLLLASGESIINFFIGIYGLGNKILDDTGTQADLWMFSTVLYTTTVFTGKTLRSEPKTVSESKNTELAHNRGNVVYSRLFCRISVCCAVLGLVLQSRSSIPHLFCTCAADYNSSVHSLQRVTGIPSKQTAPYIWRQSEQHGLAVQIRY